MALENSGISISPDDVNAAAGTFAAQQETLRTAWSALQDRLDADDGMAGNDGGARKFSARYDPAVGAAWQAFGAGVRTLGGISIGLVATANNYLRAEAHSTVHGSAPQEFPGPLVYTDVSMATPSSSIGSTSSGVPEFLAKYWPNGDPGKLRDAAAAWRAAAESVGDVIATLHGAVASLTASNRTECLDAMSEFWNTLGGPDGGALFTSLRHVCTQLAAACDSYAGAIDKAHHDLKVALAEIGVGVALTSAVGILLSVFTFGGSDVAAGAADAAEVAAVAEPVVAGFEAAVAAGVEGAVDEGMAAALEATAADTSTIEAVEAETSSVDSTIEDELAEAEGKAQPPEEPVPAVDRGVADIFEPDGQPIGEPGKSPEIRTMSEPELDQTWQRVLDEYGPAQRTVTPKGNIDYVETPDGGRIQLRDFSKSGGKTIDINVDGVDVDKIHVK